VALYGFYLRQIGCMCICLSVSVRAVTGKRFKLSTQKSVRLQSMAGPRYALILRSQGQSIRVRVGFGDGMGWVRDVGPHVDLIARYSSGIHGHSQTQLQAQFKTGVTNYCIGLSTSYRPYRHRKSLTFLPI